MRMLSRFSVLLAAGSALFASGCALLSAVTGADDWTPQSRTGWIAVRPDNGVWDDEYGRTADPRDCSFEFEVSRCRRGIRVDAVVQDDFLVSDDCAPGAVSCPSWDDDNLEVFFDGGFARAGGARAERETRNGGEFTLVANGAAQSDFSGQPGSFGRSWTGTARPERQADGSWRIRYELHFSWTCLGRRRPPAADEDVSFGFNICVHDDDDGGRNNHALYWRGNPDRPYRDRSRFGTITLKGCK